MDDIIEAALQAAAINEVQRIIDDMKARQVPEVVAIYALTSLVAGATYEAFEGDEKALKELISGIEDCWMYMIQLDKGWPNTMAGTT